jgi:AhpD family alkylhydroperoxidase
MKQARMNSPVMTLPGAMDALQALAESASKSSLPKSTIDLVHLRASQINGCSVCVDMHSRGARKRGETDARLMTVAAWRDAPYFTDAERAALALTEAATRIADRPDAVSDEIFEEAAKHFDQNELAALVLQIAMINTWNRLNLVTGQVAGDWTAQWAYARRARATSDKSL